ncbi:MAG: phosphate ABC transporter substrate-binding protein [Chloroflexota bacterium]
MRSVQIVLALLLLALPLAGCARAGAGITLAGSTSVQPFAEMVAEQYMTEHHDQVINVQGGGSSAGINAAETGAAQIGMSSRELKPEEEAQLTPVVIALDAIAVVVNPRNPMSDLGIEQIRSIFTGQTTNWSALGGPDKTITVVSREEGSGTRGSFQELVMGEQDVYSGAIVQDSNGAVRQVVADDPNAIGYISLGLVNDQVKPIDIGGVKPSNENVRKEDYKLVRPFLFVVKGTPSKEAQAFIDYTLSSKGQATLASEGLVPAR